MNNTKKLPLFLLSHQQSGAALLKSCLTKSNVFTDWQSSGEDSDIVSDVSRLLAGQENNEVRFGLLNISYGKLKQQQFNSWIRKMEFPIVHFVRENVLDCVLSQLVEKENPVCLDASQIAKRVHAVRKETLLAKADLPPNSIEVQFEKLFDPNGRIRMSVVHQICGWLGIDQSLIRAESRNHSCGNVASSSIEETKRKLRPDLMRVGMENYFSLPKAA